MSRPQSLRTVVAASPFAAALVALVAGCSDSSDSPDEGAGLRVISPNGGEVWAAGSPESVRWTGAARALGVTVQLSDDSGASWMDLASDVPDAGTLEVIVPGLASPSCLVRVLDPESGEADISDAPFEIIGGIRVTSPNGDERLTVGDTSAIRWTAAGVQAVSVELSRDGGSSWEQIAPSLPASAGTVQWTADGGGLGLPQTSCLVRVSDLSGTEAPDESDDFFTIWEGTWTYPGRVVARPGRFYVFRFADPVDGAAVGTTWQGAEVAGTFLAPMFRPAVTMKADDLRTPIHDRFYRYFDLMAARGMPASGGLICESLLEAAPGDIECLSRLNPALVEVYHHGYDHSFDDGRSEFNGTGLDFQLERLTMGADLARAALGLELHAFGAPFNATDDDTVAALELAPAIEVVFYQPYVDGRLTYPRDLDVEIDPGLMFDLDEFKALYAGVAHNDVLAVQCHPAECDEVNLAKMMEVVDFLAGEANRRFTAPTAYARWLVDRDSIALKKTRSTRYELDF
ncbi:MAG: DUF2334 domain-containing protein, partial [Planctomycetota bacterium]